MSKKSWDIFIATNSSPSSFLQSWEWGEFQEALGNKVYHFSFPSPLVSLREIFTKGEGGPTWVGPDEGGIEFAAQIIVKKLPLGQTYLEIPKGPVVTELGIRNQELWKQFIAKLRQIGKEEKGVLARINPPYYDLSPTLPSPGEGVTWRKPEILLRQVEPENTVVVDLRKGEDELLRNMHEKARYNIRLAQRKGVTVRDATADQEAFEKFLDLLEETTKRDRIVSWPRERFWKFRERFMPPHLSSPTSGEEVKEGDIPRATLLVGEQSGKILAAAIIMLFGDAGTYLYAASSAEERTANAPSLVLWEAIRSAKRAGKRWYDMWGVAPAEEENHPWAGITRFKSRYIKLGTTGREVHGTGAQDLLLNWGYYYLFKTGKVFRQFFPNLLDSY